MKKLCVCICLLILFGCTSKQEAYQTIDSTKAYEMIQENKEVVIVDVRTKEEFASGHIENAINVPVESMNDIETITTNKTATILVYCRSGNRSAKASAQLVEMGYTAIYDFGGIQDWSYDIVK